MLIIILNIHFEYFFLNLKIFLRMEVVNNENLENNSFKKSVQNEINAIKLMIDCPRLYLIHYFEDARAKVDIAFEKKILTLNGQMLDEEENKLRLDLLDIIEKCEKKCLNNALNHELITEATEKMSTIEINQNEIRNKKESVRLTKIKLESHLLANDSYLVLVNDNNLSIGKEIIIVEDEFNPIEIEYLIRR